MNLVLMGAWGIGETALATALDVPGWTVVAVLTRPFDAATKDPWRNRVWTLAEHNGVPVNAMQDINAPETVQWLRSLDVDLYLSAAFPKLLRAPVLSIPRFGALNLHGSLLPKNRGTSPVNWALLRDEPQVGLTMHFIDVTDDDLPGMLADRIKDLAPPMIREALTRLAQNQPLPRIPQNHALMTLAPRLTVELREIDWTQSARQVWSFVRGLAQPGLGAWTRCNGKRCVLERAKIEKLDGVFSSPGVILQSQGWLRVACGTGILAVPRASIRMENGALLDEFNFGQRFG
jgi:methionyl-tRNA formyltransferase